MPSPSQPSAGKSSAITAMKLGDLLVREGLLTTDALNKALAVQKQAEEYKPLGQVCVELKLITKQELQRFLSKYKKHIQIGELLVNMGLITPAQVQKILEMQRVSSKRFGALLVEGGFISEAQLTNALSIQLDIPRMIPSLELIDVSLLEGLDEEFLRFHEFIPVDRHGNQMTVIMSDPLNANLIQQLVDRFKCKIVPAIATPTEIRSTIAEYFGPRRTLPTEATLEQDLMLKVDQDKTKQEVASMARFLIRSAVEEGATALHVERHENYVRVRLRQDGIMIHKTDLPARLGPALIETLKAAFRHKGSDGLKETITTTVANRKVDLSVSCFDGFWGENLVIHILYAPSRMLLFENLSFSPLNLSKIYTALDRAGGIVIMASPIRGGKSTLMYASLLYLNQTYRSILSLENSVHYTIPGIVQNHYRGNDNTEYETLVKAMTEYDSDILMVSHIPDFRTAEAIHQAALIGRKVITSLHATDTTTLLYSLSSMGCNCLLTTPVPVTLVAQRLLRRLCEKCKVPYTPGEAELVSMKILAGDRGSYQFYTAKGCKECQNTGYTGLTAVHEVLEINEDIRNAVLQNKSASTLRDLARRDTHMISLLEDGIFKASTGITSLEEVRRVALIYDVDSKTARSIRQIYTLCSGLK